MNVYIYTDSKEWEPNENTLLYYPLTSNLVDQMGNGNTGVAHGNVTFNANPGSTTGCYVNGANSIYVTGMSIGVNGKSTCTMNVWANFISKTEHGNIVGYNSNYNYTQPFKIYSGASSSNAVGFSLMWGTSSSNHGSVGMYNDGSLVLNSGYHNFCVTVDNLVVKFYLDGVDAGCGVSGSKVDSYTMPRAIASGTSECQLGWGGYYGSGRTATGYVRNYIVETIPWTSEDVQDYYNNTKSLYGIS